MKTIKRYKLDQAKYVIKLDHTEYTRIFGEKNNGLLKIANLTFTRAVKKLKNDLEAKKDEVKILQRKSNEVSKLYLWNIIQIKGDCNMKLKPSVQKYKEVNKAAKLEINEMKEIYGDLRIIRLEARTIWITDEKRN